MQRQFGNALWIGTVSLFLAITLNAEVSTRQAKEPLAFIRQGHCAYQIILSAKASPSEKRAAEVLQQYIATCTDSKPAIQTEPSLMSAPGIIVGACDTARKLGVEPKPEELGEQGYVIRVVGPHIVIVGTRNAGTLYGVYDFLEKVLGVRWYAPGVTKTPKATNIELQEIDTKIRPAFLYRQTTYTWPGGDGEFRNFQRENSGTGDAENPLGQQYAFVGRCHTYYNFISPDEYFEKHPEYFSQIGGKRIRNETQLCLTNPEVLDIVTQKMLKQMKQLPQYRQFNFSQMDHYNYCQCPRCRAINKKYGTAGGTQYWFINQLAERTSKVYPDKLIGTLAYMYTEEPPQGLKMHPNVAVWLCHMFPSCDSHSVATCERNADYKRRAQAWSKICSHVYIWHYITDFAHYYNPFPNFRAVAEDMKFYRTIGVEGIFLQGMGDSGGGGEFSLLRPYVMMKLAYNPDQNLESLVDDFLEGYYGPAGKPIGEYFRLIHDKVQNENIHMHLYTNPAQGYLTDEVLKRASKLFDEAESAVKDNPTLLERVKVARIPLFYARIFPRNGYRIEGDKLIWNQQGVQAGEIMEFIQRMNLHGFTQIRECGENLQEFAMLCSLFCTELPVVTIQNDTLAVDVVPLLGGRAVRIRDKKTGKDITRWNNTTNLYFPFAGGLECREGEIFRPEGWMEPAQLVRGDAKSITLRSKTARGFTLERTLKLEGNSRVLQVSMRLINETDVPRTGRLRSHLELDLGDLKKTRVNFMNLNGKMMERNMDGIIAGLREGEHFYDRQAPKDAWTFTGSKGLRLTQRFDNKQLDFAWLYAYPEDMGELEVELWSPQKILKPGESISLEQSLEIEG